MDNPLSIFPTIDRSLPSTETSAGSIQTTSQRLTLPGGGGVALLCLCEATMPCSRQRMEGDVLRDLPGCLSTLGAVPAPGKEGLDHGPDRGPDHRLDHTAPDETDAVTFQRNVKVGPGKFKAAPKKLALLELRIERHETEPASALTGASFAPVPAEEGGSPDGLPVSIAFTFEPGEGAAPSTKASVCVRVNVAPVTANTAPSCAALDEKLANAVINDLIGAMPILKRRYDAEPELGRQESAGAMGSLRTALAGLKDGTVTGTEDGAAEPRKAAATQPEPKAGSSKAGSSKAGSSRWTFTAKKGTSFTAKKGASSRAGTSSKTGSSTKSLTKSGGSAGSAGSAGSTGSNASVGSAGSNASSGSPNTSWAAPASSSEPPPSNTAPPPARA
ncbi:hypothetical protein TeGR_g13901, partial [Tetraparma gracilis]